jgi:hypothetical protein
MPATKPTITVTLTYHNDGTITSDPRDLVFHKGDHVVFVSSGSKDKVFVKLNPEAYKPSQFTPDSGPVEVTADSTGTPYAAQCGIIKGNKAIGWIPPGHVTPEMERVRPSHGIDTKP